MGRKSAGAGKGNGSRSQSQIRHLRSRQDIQIITSITRYQVQNNVQCDVCSPKASLAQGREGIWGWKGTPELTEAYLLTRNRLEVRGMNRSIRQDGEPKVHRLSHYITKGITIH
jgi:hypothetical protein